MNDRSSVNKIPWMIVGFGGLKLLLHLLTNTNYGLHRDELLYFDEGKHLAWGFFEVPPMTPFIGKLADLLGGNVFAIRLFPAIAGAVIVVLACRLVKDLGGKNWTILITGFSLTLTPALLGSNTLFQPVSFNQLFWFLIAYSVVQIIRDQQIWRWWMLGLLIGLGLLTKYSLAFYLLALLLGVGITKERKLLWNPFFLGTLGIALVLVLPNIWWQYQHRFPLFQHMAELRETQLVHVNWSHFLPAQFIFHKGFTLVWLAGLIGLLTWVKVRPYRSLGFAFLLVLLLIGGLQGKAYYTLGAFLILFPFGALVIESFLRSTVRRSVFLLVIFVTTLPFYPFAVPILKLEALKKYCHYASRELGINYMLRWEDGQYYELPQDVADMHGWEELVQRVAKIYHALPEGKKSQCMIYGGSYAHAASVNYYRAKYRLPEAYSFNSSYVFWLDADVDFNQQILIDDRKQDSSTWFQSMNLVDSIQNPNAREKGYIYFRSEPKIDVQEAWKTAVEEELKALQRGNRNKF